MKTEDNFIEIKLLLGCSFVNLLHIFRTVSHKNALRGLLLNVVTNKRQKGDLRFTVIQIVFIIYYLTYLFIFSIVLTEKYKSIKAIEDDFYHKVIEAKCIEAVTRRCSRIFAKFTGKHLCQGLFSNKVAGWGWDLQLYLKKESGKGVFLLILQNF